MSGVVLRCSNCGTVQATTGECEACHEADVRYFCTNHTPGLWLDQPVCGRCGARFGEAAPATTRTTTIDAPARPPVVRKPRPTVRDPDGEPSPWGARLPEFTDPDDDGPAYGGRVASPLAEILAAAARASMARSTRGDYDVGLPPRRRGGGCLRRLLLLTLFLLTMFVLVPMYLAGAFIHLF
jgi:hypothetical protein